MDFITEVAGGQMHAPDMDPNAELARLKKKFDLWRKEFKVRALGPVASTGGCTGHPRASARPPAAAAARSLHGAAHAEAAGWSCLARGAR